MQNSSSSSLSVGPSGNRTPGYLLVQLQIHFYTEYRPRIPTSSPKNAGSADPGMAGEDSNGFCDPSRGLFSDVALEIHHVSAQDNTC